MRLTAFRIENFRSVVDTGWRPVSPDNITCLIGQNESGKTSVLEGLSLFFTGEISEDVLRSDLSLPVVSCRFQLPGNAPSSMFPSADRELASLLDSLQEVTLVRKWRADLESDLFTGGEVEEYYMRLAADREEETRATLDRLRESETEIIDARERVAQLEKEIALLGNQHDSLTSENRFSKNFRWKGWGAGKKVSDEAVAISEKLDKRNTEIGERKAFLEGVSGIARGLDELNAISSRIAEAEDTLREISALLEERHQTMTLLSGQTIDELSAGSWEKVLRDYRDVTSLLSSLRESWSEQVAVCGFLIDGLQYESARIGAGKLFEKRRSEPSLDEMGEEFFKEVPLFHMFEDFGSLLPNRIDLEDIITGNDQVEGYKAARNFLTIAGLDYNFFQQPSSRILKQKIENLNERLTHNFQEFWQQYVGRHNKIRINFELDHYSTNHGDKAGKPYLEFWVKDEGERLYPKQRSRGVRWFLSFYLELMAAAGRENRQMVLLVDEPGVSLHARAQEDVLKVFEDIRGNIQVIYTTHSPHLVDINKLHRVLAVQRDDTENHRSATTILDAASLVNASPDTLSPLQSIMGNPIGNSEFAVDKVNIIVNDIGTYYLLTAAVKLAGFRRNLHFIPSVNSSSVPLMCNILLGWGMKFAVLLFEADREEMVEEQLRMMALGETDEGPGIIINMAQGFRNAEDLFSTLDFKNHILHTREGITTLNSEYVRDNELPRNFLFSKFLADVDAGRIKSSQLDEETSENLEMLMSVLENY
jgi:AAA15 family ATPase/GTPase